jgi:hypothetical protein
MTAEVFLLDLTLFRQAQVLQQQAAQQQVLERHRLMEQQAALQAQVGSSFLSLSSVSSSVDGAASTGVLVWS